MLQQVAESSLREIDDLIVVLQRRREELLSESARVQRAVIEYAKLSQSTMQSTRIITESLSHLNKVPAPPHKSECHVGDVSNEEHCDSGGAAFAQHDMGGQAGETAVPVSSDVSDLPEEASGPSISRDGDTDETGQARPGTKPLIGRRSPLMTQSQPRSTYRSGRLERHLAAEALRREPRCRDMGANRSAVDV